MYLAHTFRALRQNFANIQIYENLQKAKQS